MSIHVSKMVNIYGCLHTFPLFWSVPVPLLTIQYYILTTSSTSMIYIVFSMFTVHPFLVIIFIFVILCSSRGSHQDQPGCSDARGTALVSCARRLVWVLYWTAFPVVTPCRCVALGGLLHSTQCVQRRFWVAWRIWSCVSMVMHVTRYLHRHNMMIYIWFLRCRIWPHPTPFAAAEAPRASDYRRGGPRQRRLSPTLSAANATGGPRGVYGQCNATIRSNSHRGIEKAVVLEVGCCGCL